MAADHVPNFPDVLGTITGGVRYNVSVAQVALAIRPRNVRAGRPFETILLIQNAADVNIDVTVTLHLPQDAKKRPNRFLTKTSRLMVGLRPAEVGYVVLPVNCLPDTAISDSYKMGVGIEVKVDGKPRRVRAAEGGGAVELEHLSSQTTAAINDLKKLTYSTARRGLMGAVLEAPFNILSAQIGQLVELKAAWVSLWKMSDLRDDRILLTRFAETLQTQLLPRLKRDNLYQPLLQATQHRFRQAGFDLEPIEAHYITKILVYVLEMAIPDESTPDYLNDAHYDVMLSIKRVLRGDRETPILPAWFKAMLNQLDNAAATAEQPAVALAGPVYDELLRDAMRLGFQMIATTTGKKMGSDDEIGDYIQKVIGKLESAQPALNFSDVYLPLLIAGVIIYDRVVLKTEKLGDDLTQLAQLVKARQAEIRDDEVMVYETTQQVVDRALQKYGYRA